MWHLLVVVCHVNIPTLVDMCVTFLPTQTLYSVLLSSFPSIVSAVWMLCAKHLLGGRKEEDYRMWHGWYVHCV